MSNSLGQSFRITTSGESHGKSLSVIIDGCPAGIPFDHDLLSGQLSRRRPGQSKITTQRKEDDSYQVLSGLFEGVTTGAPICIQIPNKDQKSGDYFHISESFRPSHADFTYQSKYGIRDYRGGGRSSARETANWVAAGSVALMLLKATDVRITSFVSSVGKIKVEKGYDELNLSLVDDNIVRCPDHEKAMEMIDHIGDVRKMGDTVGGTITCVVRGVPVGWGEPVFNKLHAALGQAMLSINAVKGFEFGSGFSGSEMYGSEHNDEFVEEQGKVITKTNFSGGIQGGISNGQDIYFKVAFKPVATIMKDQESVNHKGEATTVKGKGRHDPCVVPRAVPIVDAMTALVLADFYLLTRGNASFQI